MAPVPIAELTPEERRCQERLRKRKSRAEADLRIATDEKSRAKARQKVAQAEAELMKAKKAAEARATGDLNIRLLRDILTKSLSKSEPGPSFEDTAAVMPSNGNPLLHVCHLASSDPDFLSKHSHHGIRAQYPSGGALGRVEAAPRANGVQGGKSGAPAVWGPIAGEGSGTHTFKAYRPGISIQHDKNAL
jgi:hypothetical protein